MGDCGTYHINVLHPHPLSRNKAGSSYAKNHLEHSDYYSEKEKVVGEWMGEGAPLLGLSGKVKRADFDKLMKSVDPRTGESLRMRSGGNKKTADGKALGNATAAIDCGLSAPKGFSVLSMRDKRLKAAWDNAIRATVPEIERRMAVRDQKKGKEELRAAKIVIARYSHTASRSLDPQIHDHLILMNIGFDSKTGEWRSLDNRKIFEHRILFTEVFLSLLAKETMALGYELENHCDKKGKRTGWEVVGISDEVREKYSERSAQKDAAIAAELSRRQALLGKYKTGAVIQPLEAWLLKRGEVWANPSALELSDAEVAKIVRDTRPGKKLIHISTADVEKRQAAKLTERESEELDSLIATAQSRETPEILKQETCVMVKGRYVTALEAVKWSIDHCLERQSVETEAGIMKAATEQFMGLDPHMARVALLLLQDKGKILMSLGKSNEIEITTEEKITEEADMLSLVIKGIGKHGRLASSDFQIPTKASKAQKDAIEALLGSRDFVTAFIGAPGSGKTYAAQILANAIKSSGQQVVALAPTASAVRSLKEEAGFTSVQTVAALLINPKEQDKIQPGAVLYIDEGGMLSTRTLFSLIEIAKQKSARIILQGDPSQIHSVDYGDAMGTCLAETNTARAELSEIRRQKNKQYRDAITMLRKNPEKGLGLIQGMGAIHEIDSPHELPKRLAEEYFKESEVIRGRAKQSVLITAGTYAIIDKCTDAIREERIRRGEVEVSQEIEREVIQSTQWSEAQKRLAQNFKDNFLLQFRTDAHSFQRGETGEVISINKEQNELTVRNPKTGDLVTFDPSKISKLCEVSRKKKIRVSAGDKILITANKKLTDKTKFTNGEMGVVKSVNLSNGDVLLQDGRTLDSNCKDWSLGYCTTAHKSQGMSIDTVLVAPDSMNRELFLVAASRGKFALKVFTRSFLRLQSGIQVSGKRRSAIGFARDLVRRKIHENERSERSREGTRRAVREYKNIETLKGKSHRDASENPARSIGHT